MLVGFVGVTAAIVGWLFQPLSMAWRLGLLAVGLLSLRPDFASTPICTALTGGASA